MRELGFAITAPGNESRESSLDLSFDKSGPTQEGLALSHEFLKSLLDAHDSNPFLVFSMS